MWMCEILIKPKTVLWWCINYTKLFITLMKEGCQQGLKKKKCFIVFEHKDDYRLWNWPRSIAVQIKFTFPHFKICTLLNLIWAYSNKIFSTI